MVPPEKCILVPRENFEGGSLKGESQEYSLGPKGCDTNRVNSENFRAQLWIQGIIIVSIFLCWSLYSGDRNSVG